MQIARQSVTGHGDRVSGLAAHTMWAEHLLRDEDFPADDLPTLRERFNVHDNAVGTVAEGRWYGSEFLGQMARRMSGMAEAFYAAAACGAAEHGLMWRVWGLNGLDRTDENARKLADPEVRRQIVPTILQARDKYEEAIGHLERGLARG